MKANNDKLPEYVSTTLAQWGDMYQPSKGMLVRNSESGASSRFMQTKYSWYPAREAPLDEVKGLTRLKGHLQKGQWLTKFRKQVRKDEMTDDLILAAVQKDKQQTYTRIMPTSPP